MRCPACGAARMSVSETRVGDHFVRRKRACNQDGCDFRGWTVELLVGRAFDFRLRIGPSGPELAKIEDPT